MMPVHGIKIMKGCRAKASPALSITNILCILTPESVVTHVCVYHACVFHHFYSDRSII